MASATAERTFLASLSYPVATREKLESALVGQGEWALEIIKRSDAAEGSELLSRRWVVERAFAGLNRNRRLAKNFEATLESSIAWLQLASVQLMPRRLANV